MSAQEGCSQQKSVTAPLSLYQEMLGPSKPPAACCVALCQADGRLTKDPAGGHGTTAATQQSHLESGCCISKCLSSFVVLAVVTLACVESG